jgi:hypothetical protein
MRKSTDATGVRIPARHIHERISTQAILRMAARQDVTRDLFAEPKLSYAQAVRCYQHEMGKRCGAPTWRRSRAL